MTWNRNQILRRSSTGRLLLILESCVALANDNAEMSSRLSSRLTNELSYACALADEAGIQNGWVRHRLGTFALVFAISTGDVVFTGLNENLGSDPFPAEPIISDNSWVWGILQRCRPTRLACPDQSRGAARLRDLHAAPFVFHLLLIESAAVLEAPALKAPHL